MTPLRTWSSMIVKPLLELPIDDVQFYWQTLYMNDTLKYRLANVDEPTWSDVVAQIAHEGRNMFMVQDVHGLVGEFALQSVTDCAYKIHFSMHPDNPTRYSWNVAKFALNEMFSWPKVQTLLANISVKNRASIQFALKMGFRKLHTLPNCSKFLGYVTDTAVLVRSR